MRWFLIVLAYAVYFPIFMLIRLYDKLFTRP